MASPTHVRKRPYQPSISSFFNRSGGSNKPAGQATSPRSPPLPAETQASLLSVGMRVRKSVPEGYKTHKTLGTTGYPFPSTPAPVTPIQQNQAFSSTTMRELTPFCGLHKTGGWAQQPGSWVPSSSAPAAIYSGEDDESDLPRLSRSQSTLPSTQASFASEMPTEAVPNRKRSYEDDMEDDLDAYFADMEKTDAVGASRPIAQPKASARRPAIVTQDGGVLVRQSNDDFEEAGFLVAAEWMDVDENAV